MGKITGNNFYHGKYPEIPHRLESHNERILRTTRRPYDTLTAVAQRKILHTARRPYDTLTHVLPDVPMTYCRQSHFEN